MHRQLGDDNMGVTNDETGATTRRTVLASAGVVGVAATLAGCGSGSSSSDTGTTGGGATPTTGTTTGGGGGGGSAIKTADIPVGGGKVYDDQKVVVTQPAAGQFKAFTAVCTHAGCIVNEVSDNTIHCPCHGSSYSATDGSVKGGPAPKALAPKTVSVSGDTITVS
jgi:Rieske Fe-S protein